MKFSENILKEIKTIAKVFMVIMVSVYMTNHTPTFLEIVLLYTATSIYERMNQTDFWIMRG